MSDSGVTDWNPTDSALRVAENERKYLLGYLIALILRNGGALILSDAELCRVSDSDELEAEEDAEGNLTLTVDRR